MRIYSAHVRPLIADPDKDIVFVKEGFNWLAFLFTVIWALWNRLWLVALGVLAVEVIANLAVYVIGLSEPAGIVVSLGIAVLFGTLANDLHRWTLGRRGFRDAGIVTGGDRDAAMLRFFDQRPDLAAGRF